jgi:hypothetical protein
MATVTGGGREEMHRLAAALKTAGKDLRDNLRKQFRQAAKPVVQATRNAVLSSPSEHDGTLRREAAKTVSASVLMSARQVQLNVVSRGTRMPEGRQTLNGYLNDSARWKHPVYGHRKTWVRQRSRAEGWFSDTISGHADDLRRAAEIALEETAKKLEH